jgi:hypothetical protein
MKLKFFMAACLAVLNGALQASVPLTESTFTEVIREANVVAAGTKTETPAKTSALFKAPDFVRTGSASRVEMTAPDHTITRVGANTVFTFDTAERTIRMESGSVLFHAPKGAGGGTIKYRGTAAAVLGTTMICTVLPDGSFKVLDLEGHVEVMLANGKSITLNPGEMVIVMASGDVFEPVMTFNLGEVVPHLILIRGFSTPPPSLPLIEEAIQAQDALIAAGKITTFVPPMMAEFGLELVIKLPAINFPTELLSVPDHTTKPVSPVK